MPKTNGSEIKFAETLKDLVDSSAFKANRKPIWQSVHITSAALSQYLSGDSRPRLETLVGLSTFFGVSLDYLVLGRDESRSPTATRTPDSYIDRALAEVQDKLGARTWMAAQIGQELASQIDEAARTVLEAKRTSEGVITNDEAFLLESFSLDTKLLATSLGENATTDSREGTAAGRFSQVVAHNLTHNPARTYNFLLPKTSHVSWHESVQAIRSVLTEELGVPRSRLRNCRFQLSNVSAFNGVVLYRLDLISLRQEQPIFHQMLLPYVSTEGWIAYATHFNTSYTNVLYEPQAARQVLDTFEKLWAESDEEL